MNNQDWERFGEEIRRSVQDAVDTQDFSRLNQTITDTVNGAADYFAQSVRNVGDIVNQNIQAQKERSAYRYQQNGQRYRYRSGGYEYQGDPADQNNPQYQSAQKAQNSQSAGDRAYTSGSRNAGSTEYTGTQRGTMRTNAMMQKPALYSNAVSTRVGGILLSVFGYSVCGISALVLAIAIIDVMMSGVTAEVTAVFSVFGALAVCFGVMAGVGTKMLGNLKRFRSYIRELGGREYCDIKELAEHLNKSTKFVAKDLEKMISKGWFRQGHLDSQKACLMVSHDAYRQYTELMGQMEQKQREEREAQARAAQEKASMEESGLSPEVQEVIRAGEDYIRKIHECNDAIPGEEISAKISRMEMLVDKIFDRVEQNPECVSDMHRMMEYYLPTTVKLLEAYEELDSQPVQGPNIVSSKREIEKTLDTLNVAFEKLLDDLFQDTAWDVSSDISVLHTMLAREGLTEKDFKK